LATPYSRCSEIDAFGLTSERVAIHTSCIFENVACDGGNHECRAVQCGAYNLPSHSRMEFVMAKDKGAKKRETKKPKKEAPKAAKKK